MTRAPELAWVFLALIGLAGCSKPLPTYPHMPDRVALDLIADRLADVRTISATTDVTLTSADGRSIHLDGAFVAEMPTRARLRAWKFGTPVFDLTVLPQGVWILAQEQAGEDPRRLDAASLPAASMSPILELLNPGFFRRAIAGSGSSDGPLLVVTGAALGRQDVHCEIDRATLTPRRFTLLTEAGSAEFTLDRYAIVGDTVWPRRLGFRNDSGQIVVRLHEIEINTDVPDRAFVPPARARKLP